MPTVKFLERSGKELASLAVNEGTLLFDAARKAGLPVASSCTAGSVCGKCNFIILKGEENLSLQNDTEKALLLRDKKPITNRISCLTKVLGDCCVSTTYW